MTRTLDTRRRRTLSGALFAAAWIFLSAGNAPVGAADPVSRVDSAKPVSQSGPSIPLPPLAVVLEQDDEAWLETGEIVGSLEITRRNFQRSLAGEGWVLSRIIPLSRGAKRSTLCIWKRQGREVLVMLWQKEPGKCGFSWGIPE